MPMTMTNSRSLPRKHGWVVPAIAIFLVGLQQSIFLVHLSAFADQILGLGPARLSLLVFAFHASSMLSSLGITWVTDRMGHRMRLFGVLCGLSMVGYGSLMFTGSFAPALASTVLCVAPAASQNALVFAHLRAEDGPPRRIVSVRAAFSAAWVMGPAIGAAVWSRFGAIGLLTLLVCISSALGPVSLTFGSTTPATRVNARAAIATRANWSGMGLAFAAFAFLQGTTTGALIIVPLMLAKELPGGGSAGLLFSLCALIEIPMLIVLGKAAERWGALRLLILGCSCGVAYYIILWNARSQWPLYAAQPLNAFFIAAIVGPGLVWFQNLAPDRVGLTTALFLNAYNTGGLIMTPLIGAVATRAGTYQSAAGALALLVVGGSALLATVRVHRSVSVARRLVNGAE